MERLVVGEGVGDKQAEPPRVRVVKCSVCCWNSEHITVCLSKSREPQHKECALMQMWTLISNSDRHGFSCCRKCSLLNKTAVTGEAGVGEREDMETLCILCSICL